MSAVQDCWELTLCGCGHETSGGISGSGSGPNLYRSRKHRVCVRMGDPWILKKRRRIATIFYGCNCTVKL